MSSMQILKPDIQFVDVIITSIGTIMKNNIVSEGTMQTVSFDWTVYLGISCNQKHSCILFMCLDSFFQ